MSRDVYSFEQNWWWTDLQETDVRKFSMLALYRKYCEADIQELIRLSTSIFYRRRINAIEPRTLFSIFPGSVSFFALFYSSDETLAQVNTWLEVFDFDEELDD